jgi:thymidylate synthase (FAD)
MSIRLISKTEVSDEFLYDENKMLLTSEEYIAYIARVSNPSNQSNLNTSSKLLKYCIDHRHWSIFEMIDFTFEINTTRDIGRQILRHRSFSFQEFSQRYADPSQLGTMIREARLQDKKNRQNSIHVDDDDLKEKWEKRQKYVVDFTQEQYKWAIENGIAKEQARVVLPEGLTMSRLYMKGSLRSWITYCAVRCDKSTQLEHREIAIKIWEILKKHLQFLDDGILIKLNTETNK